MVAKTYKVTFEMEGKMGKPVDPIHLDGLLAFARTQEDGGDWTNQLDLPVERFETEAGWCFKASSLYYEPISQQTVAKTNKTDVTYLASLLEKGITKVPNKVSAASGKYKASLYFDTVLLVKELIAYVATDNPGRVHEMLATINFIGPNRKLGLGAVLSVNIEEASIEEADLWQNRHLPVAIDEACYPISGHLQPPYWNKSNQNTIYRRPWSFEKYNQFPAMQ
jgi:CRISPR type IV-associated protein Csf3